MVSFRKNKQQNSSKNLKLKKVKKRNGSNSYSIMQYSLQEEGEGWITFFHQRRSHKRYSKVSILNNKNGTLFMDDPELRQGKTACCCKNNWKICRTKMHKGLHHYAKLCIRLYYCEIQENQICICFLKVKFIHLLIYA